MESLVSGIHSNQELNNDKELPSPSILREEVNLETATVEELGDMIVSELIEVVREDLSL